jgi:hypothetical protein
MLEESLLELGVDGLELLEGGLLRHGDGFGTADGYNIEQQYEEKGGWSWKFIVRPRKYSR